HEPGPRPGRDDRARRAPSLRRLPVPSRVPVEALLPPPALRRLHQGRPGLARSEGQGAGGPGDGAQDGAALMKTVRVGGSELGDGKPLLLIAGPCVIESEAQLLAHARKVKALAERHQLPLVFKASFDKANRTNGK